MGYLLLVGSNILLLMVVQQLVEILVFSQEKDIKKKTDCIYTEKQKVPMHAWGKVQKT